MKRSFELETDTEHPVAGWTAHEAGVLKPAAPSRKGPSGDGWRRRSGRSALVGRRPAPSAPAGEGCRMEAPAVPSQHGRRPPGTYGNQRPGRLGVASGSGQGLASPHSDLANEGGGGAISAVLGHWSEAAVISKPDVISDPRNEGRCAAAIGGRPPAPAAATATGFPAAPRAPAALEGCA
jgi:hypothetical protein